MDFIKEVIVTFSEYDKEEFVRFLSRKRPTSARKDVGVFLELYRSYQNNSPVPLKLKGSQNYHAIRKRISKEFEGYLMLKTTNLDRFKKESKLMMVQYFINLNKYEIAWELLLKEEKEAESQNNTFINLLIQRMKLQILPFYAQESFIPTQKKLLVLQKQLAVEDQFQLYFIQIQQELKNQLSLGEVKGTSGIIKDCLKNYTALKDLAISPKTHLRTIEIIRTEYLIKRRYYLLVNALKEYYENVVDLFVKGKNLAPELARLEYIMAHAYYNVRQFDSAREHLSRINELMKKNNAIHSNFIVKYISISGSIAVFSEKIEDAIIAHNNFLAGKSHKINEKDFLNLSLNLVAYYCTCGDFKQANRELLYMNKSTAYYQKNMGREWLIRKEMIRVICQVEIGNIENSLTILKSIKVQHQEMIELEEYRLVSAFIDLVIRYLNDPFSSTIEQLEKAIASFNIQKQKLFEDPKLLAFYSWLKSKLLSKNLYDVLLSEYALINK